MPPHHTPDSDTSSQDPAAPLDRAGLIKAVWLDNSAPASIYLDGPTAVDTIGALLGYKDYMSATLTDNLALWMGSSSDDDTNHGASRVLNWLLDDLAGGTYPATDTERDYARTLVGDEPLYLIGRCLITGKVTDGDQHVPATLPEQFTGWLTRRVSRYIDERRTALHERVRLLGDDSIWTGHLA
ncbi:MAG: hypothetical protein HOV94_13435 [Saccharothrix sp.]|nr:hypothetical protein [Saccharothrix sp.]